MQVRYWVRPQVHGFRNAINAKGNIMAEEVKRERTWGEAAEDVIIGGLKAVANGGNSRQFVAGALLGALNKDEAMQERQTRENKVKLAELQVKEAEQNILNNQAKHELLKLEEQKTRAGQQYWAENAKNQSAITASTARKAAAEATDAENKTAFNKQIQDAKAPYLKAEAKNAAEQNEADLERKKLDNARKLAQMQEYQRTAWNRDAQEHKNKFKQNFYEMAGFNELNEQGKTILEKSVAIEELSEISALVYAKQRNEDEFKYLMSQTKGHLSDDGNSWISADGTRKFDLSIDNLKKNIAEIQKRADSDAKSAHVLGTQVRSLEQGAIKDVLLSPVVKAVFGDDSGGAYQALNSYINAQEELPNGTKVPRFDRKDKELHVLARSLSGACFDGVISEKERAGLIPLMGATLQQRGLDLEVGADIDHTYVVNRFGEKTPIKIFTRQLAQNDKISIGFNKHCADVAKQNQANNQAAQAKRLYSEVFRSYGSDVAGLSNEEIAKVKNTKDEIDARAQDMGIMIETPNGYEINPKATLDDIKRMADIEKSFLSKTVPDTEIKGFWQKEYDKRMGVKKAEADKKEQKNKRKAYSVLGEVAAKYPGSNVLNNL